MSEYEAERSAVAREAAELALVRVALHYGGLPPFVLLGGLVPPMLCADSAVEHAGTTDVDVHIEIEAQTDDPESAPRLEAALRKAGFVPDKERIWRWQTMLDRGRKAVIKFELLTDNPNAQANVTISLPGCERLGAANLRGTRYAAMDTEIRHLTVPMDGLPRTVDINVTGLGGFLLAKLAAAHGRRKEKDWYDIAYVLLHNDAGGPRAAAAHIERIFPGVFDAGAPRTWLMDARANFHDDGSQGTEAYADEALLHQPDEERAQLRTDAKTAMAQFAAVFAVS